MRPPAYAGPNELDRADEGPPRNHWKTAVYFLAAILIALLLTQFWMIHSRPTPSVGLYNTWIQSTDLTAVADLSPALLQQRSSETEGRGMGAVAEFDQRDSTSGHLAMDLANISGATDGMIFLAGERWRPGSSNWSRDTRYIHVLLASVASFCLALFGLRLWFPPLFFGLVSAEALMIALAVQMM